VADMSIVCGRLWPILSVAHITVAGMVYPTLETENTDCRLFVMSESQTSFYKNYTSESLICISDTT